MMDGFPIEVLLHGQAARETMGGEADYQGVPHVAIGIWVATVAVLVLPSPGPVKHRPGEFHLLRAYSVVMATFPLLR